MLNLILSSTAIRVMELIPSTTFHERAGANLTSQKHGR